MLLLPGSTDNHFWNRALFALLALLFSSNPGFSQHDNEFFGKEFLLQPVSHAQWFDNHLPVTRIDKYSNTHDSSELFLPNGYAAYRLSDLQSYERIREKVVVTCIEVIFTDYPKRKEDWITNYYELLANRLRELFKLDSTLNSRRIAWRLVTQTSCSTSREAKSLLHGIRLLYKPKHCGEVAYQPEPQPAHDTVPVASNVPEKEPDWLDPIPGPGAMIPHNALHLIPTKEYKPPKRKKGRDEPACPKFKTRADKPRKGILRRLLN